MRVLRNPVLQFLVGAALASSVIIVGTGKLSGMAAVDQATREAADTTSLLARSVAEPEIPRGLVDGDAGAIDRFDRRVADRLIVNEVRRIKLYAEDGHILYSDETRLIGTKQDLAAEDLKILQNGGIDSELADLRKQENRFERGMGQLVEVYTRIRSPEGDPLLFEAYVSNSAVVERQREILTSFRPISLGGLLLLLLVTGPLLAVMTRRLHRAARDRERLLEAAVQASDSERRRISRDLHDGVVQDLAGTSFALSALAREAGTYPVGVQPKLADMSQSLRRGLRSLRSLLVEIYPPDLHTTGLAAALEDLVAPATTVGVLATISVSDIEDAPQDVVALVWRVAQESVRNALRHAHARTLAIRVLRDADLLVLEVVDDGEGFEVATATDKGHFGLRGLQDLIRDAGGRLNVRSSPGDGTTVRLEVRLS